MGQDSDDKGTYSSKTGYLAVDGKIRIHGLSEPPVAPLDLPQSAGKASVRIALTPGRYSWCSCGHSARQPFCDNSHRESDTNRKSYKFEVLEPVSVYVCMCKRTKDPPFCDDSCGQRDLEPAE